MLFSKYLWAFSIAACSEFQPLKAVACGYDTAVVTNDQVAIESFFESPIALAPQCAGDAGASALIEIIYVSAAAPLRIAIGKERLNCIVWDTPLLQAGLSVIGEHLIFPFATGDWGYEG
jgi:hypothetical protein